MMKRPLRPNRKQNNDIVTPTPGQPPGVVVNEADFAYTRRAMSLISLEHIRKEFRLGETNFKALDDVSLTVQAGEFVAIMGPSGSGKSTLMNIIGILDRPTEGTYTLNDQPITLTMSDRAQARLRNQTIGFIFQNFNLLANLDVLHNVMLPTQYSPRRSDTRKKATELLTQVGLGHRLKYQPNKLSGGERQRVAIARALMNDPKIILADEPTGNLDSHSGEEVLKILTDLHRAGTTLIVVTHNEEIAKLATRTIHMKDGKIV